MNKIANSWETNRLVVHTSEMEEVTELLAVFNSCAYVEPWDPTFRPVKAEEIAQLVSSSLGIGENPDERFRIQTIRLKEGHEIIGYFHVYHRVPHPDTVWISIFLVRQDIQKQRFGQEVFDGLVDQLRSVGGWNGIWLKVYLKNWPALRFWTRNGFTQIKEVRGDAQYSENTHAALVLEKKL
jgi:diamine N-acetyltransferase